MGALAYNIIDQVWKTTVNSYCKGSSNCYQNIVSGVDTADWKAFAAATTIDVKFGSLYQYVKSQIDERTPGWSICKEQEVCQRNNCAKWGDPNFTFCK
jgi:hypothetical protein